MTAPRCAGLLSLESEVVDGIGAGSCLLPLRSRVLITVSAAALPLAGTPWGHLFGVFLELHLQSEADSGLVNNQHALAL